MKRQEWSVLYLTILGIVIAGLCTFGVPTSALVYTVIVLASPPMMIFIPGGTVAAMKRVTAPKATAVTPLSTDGNLARRP